MTIVVGFVPTKEGRAALSRAVEEARTRRTTLVVINSNRGGRDFDDESTKAAEAELTRFSDEMDSEGLGLEVRQLVRGNEPAEDLISVANEIDDPRTLIPGQELVVSRLPYRDPATAKVYV